jgi:hypothetical protein
MSKRTNNEDNSEEWSIDDLDQSSDLSIDDDDFGILLDSEGNLKTVFGTDELFENPPENVIKVLEIFGIANAASITRAGITIH